MSRSAGAAALSVIAFVLGLVGWLRSTAPAFAAMPALSNGDLVFQTDRTKQMLAIWLATGSLYTHVGIIEIHKHGEPYVIEAAGRVRSIPLRLWIRHGYGQRVMIERLHGFSPLAAAQVLAAAHRYDGRSYDIFFRFDQDRIYCSELVYYAFQQGDGVSLGHVQKISELNLDNFAVRKIVALRWRTDPTCAGDHDFDSCFRDILQQRIITPVSVADDPRLKVIYSNY